MTRRTSAFARLDQRQREEQKQQQAEARRSRNEEEAARLRRHLDDTKRLPREDRLKLSRALGRMIEREFSDNEKRALRMIFRAAFNDGSDEQLKKRKRYVCFADEEPCHTLMAHGKAYLTVLDAMVKVERESFQVGFSKVDAILELCRGTTFGGASGPQLMARTDARGTFDEIMHRLVDRLAKETDVVEYFERMSELHVEIEEASDVADGCARNELVPEWRPVRYHPCTERIPWRRLSLNPDNLLYGPPYAAPTVRVARLYFPHEVLVVDTPVPWREILSIRSAIPTSKEFAAILSSSAGPVFRREEDLVKRWRMEREKDLQAHALSKVGFDIDKLNWKNLERPSGELTGKARVAQYWSAWSLDLTVTALGRPGQMDLGLSSPNAATAHFFNFTPDEVRFVRSPSDELSRNATLHFEYVFSHLAFDNEVLWFPAGDGENVFPSRGCIHDGQDYVEFEPDPFRAFDRNFWSDECESIRSDAAWHLLSSEFSDVTSERFQWLMEEERGGLRTSRNTSRKPAVRLTIDAPLKPVGDLIDGTLASAFVRSIAYGSGPYALDVKLSDAINRRVRLLDEMRSASSSQLEDALRAKGY